jgi:hypothetical protein
LPFRGAEQKIGLQMAYAAAISRGSVGSLSGPSAVMIVGHVMSEPCTTRKQLFVGKLILP